MGKYNKKDLEISMKEGFYLCFYSLMKVLHARNALNDLRECRETVSQGYIEKYSKEWTDLATEIKRLSKKMEEKYSPSFMKNSGISLRLKCALKELDGLIFCLKRFNR